MQRTGAPYWTPSLVQFTPIWSCVALTSPQWAVLGGVADGETGASSNKQAAKNVRTNRLHLFTLYSLHSVLMINLYEKI